MAATPDRHFYQMALIGPDMLNTTPPIYLCGHLRPSEGDRGGWLRPCSGRPGLGVVYDWDFIERNRASRLVFGRAN